MHEPLIGKALRLTKATTAVLPSDGMRGRFVSLPPGDVLVVKSPGGKARGILLADWQGKDILLFEQDLQDALGNGFFQSSHRL